MLSDFVSPRIPPGILNVCLMTLMTLGNVAVPAAAHSWYPQSCCHDRDCMPADRMYTDASGDTIVIAGLHRIIVPRGFPRRPSPDGHIHVCFSEFDEGVPLTCLFVPGES